uniref:Uncharacterized protein n=1 Tax=Magallana gigas TaxID=29159 RepID=K1Q7R5_MAGGI
MLHTKNGNDWPAVCHKTLPRREKEIGAAVNFVAQDSTERALKEEIDLTEKKSV